MFTEKETADVVQFIIDISDETSRNPDKADLNECAKRAGGLLMHLKKSNPLAFARVEELLGVEVFPPTTAAPETNPVVVVGGPRIDEVGEVP